MRISILGHASVLVEAGGERVLVDPLFADRFAQGVIGFHPARLIHRDRLPEPTAIVVTHLHLDHWHPPTLEQFARETRVIAPDDAFVLRRLAELGFTQVSIARPWEVITLGALELLPTPSTGEVAEFGLVFHSGDATYWHVSDSVVAASDGARVCAELGRIAVVAARYQPITPLVSYQRGLGLSHDERDGMVEWLEAACEADPSFVFPYFCDIDYLDEHAWANRWARPYSPVEIATLLRRRLPPNRTVTTVSPGDELTIESWGRVTHSPGSAPFVEAIASHTDAFEPVDVDTLFGLDDPAERIELAGRLERWLSEELVPWMRALLDSDGSPLHGLAAMHVVWQLVVHTGGGERSTYHIDFGEPPGTLAPGERADANYVVHVGGRALLAVLRGDGGSELFWLAGACRFYEKILFVDRTDGRIAAPPVRGWDLYETFPEPFSWCLRKAGVRNTGPLLDR